MDGFGHGDYDRCFVGTGLCAYRGGVLPRNEDLGV